MHPDLYAAVQGISFYQIFGAKGGVRSVRELCGRLHSLSKGTIMQRLEAVEAHLEVERAMLADAEHLERRRRKTPGDDACSRRIAKLRKLRRKLLERR